VSLGRNAVSVAAANDDDNDNENENGGGGADADGEGDAEGNGGGGGGGGGGAGRLLGVARQYAALATQQLCPVFGVLLDPAGDPALQVCSLESIGVLGQHDQ